MLQFIERLLGISPDSLIKKLSPMVDRINHQDLALRDKADLELTARIGELKVHLSQNYQNQKEQQAALDEVLIEVFAIVREASRRVLNMRHFDVQLLGGMVLHQGKIAEMKTGEGKTLVATLPAVLNALTGKGVHIVTVNDYLAKRDEEWMGRLFRSLGLSTGVIVPQQSTSDKRKAYASDILYATNNELGFDYLRDNMADSIERQVRRDFNFAIIDEVDSVLVDEARTPLIISGAPEQSKFQLYPLMKQLAGRLSKAKDKEDENGDYYLEEKSKNVVLTDRGIDQAEKLLGVDDLWSMQANFAHHLLQGIRAKEYYRCDVDYIVTINPQSGKKEVVIVDEFTGRLMHGRRWSDGLHQAVEAKEAVPIQEETLTLASITFQNFFRLYPKIGGMTGTALTEAEELKTIYNLNVIPVPTNKTNIRFDVEDQIYKDHKRKTHAIVEEIVKVHKQGRPVLVGTTSIEGSEEISQMLSQTSEMAKLVQERGQRLVTGLKALKGEGVEALTQQLKRYLDKPVSVTLDMLLEIFKHHKDKNTLPDKLNKILAKCLDEEARQQIGDDDLEHFAITLLNAVETVEEIRKGITHSVLNAKYHKQEAEIIAQAGRLGGVTIATNMAGRGTDILLGGNAEFMAKEKLSSQKVQLSPEEEAYELQKLKAELEPVLAEKQKKVQSIGGLHVIGTERHESRRIDNQLRGRAARQGDPGSTHFFLSLDDSLMRIFGGDKLNDAMDFLKAEEDLAIESPLVTKFIQNAQKKVEAHNYEIRKRLLEYDDVQDTQRKVIYRERQRILEGQDLDGAFKEMYLERLEELLYTYLDPSKPTESWLEPMAQAEVLVGEEDSEQESEQEAEKAPSCLDLLMANLVANFPGLASKLEFNSQDLSEHSFIGLQEKLAELVSLVYEEKGAELGGELLVQAQRQIFLRSVDEHWVEHLQALDSLKEGIHLRGYGNKQPLIEYKTEALGLFDRMIGSIRRQAIAWLFHTVPVAQES